MFLNFLIQCSFTHFCYWCNKKYTGNKDIYKIQYIQEIKKNMIIQSNLLNIHAPV